MWLKNKSYWCIIINPKFKICAIVSPSKAHLWHRCLGHLNQHNVKSMGLHHVTKGVTLILGSHDLCNNCQFGKHFPKPNSKETIHLWTTKPLVLIHFDICGEIHLAYLGGNIFCHIHWWLFQVHLDLFEINLKLYNIFKISRLV
jgi:hypothetical protein